MLFIIRHCNAKVGSQEIPRVTGKFGLEVQNEAGQRLKLLPRKHTGDSKHPLSTTQEMTLHMDITRWSISKHNNYVLCSRRWKSSISSVQLLSRVWLVATPWTTARQASLSITNSQRLLKLMSIESVMPSNHLTLCRPLLLLPSIFPSIRVFSSESVLCIRGPKYWSFNFNISPSSEYSQLISFRMHWLDLLAVQGTFKSLPQHHSSKASILQHSAFFLSPNSHTHT